MDPTNSTVVLTGPDVSYPPRYPPPPPPAAPEGFHLQPPPPPKRRRSRAAIVALALVVAAAGAGLGIRAGHEGSSTPADNVAASGTASETLPTVAPSALATSALDTNAIVARVDPAVVDVTTTLDGGEGAGTGMVLTSSGLVLTNNHVIEGARRIEVQIAGRGPTYTAHVIGYDVTDDVAVLQVENVSGLKAILVGDPSSVSVGDRVVAIGNALGASGPHAVTTGSIQALGQSITANDLTGSSETLSDLIQTDAALQPGDSGGPLVNSAGRVIGMDTAASAGFRRSRGSAAGFAIPIDKALAVARQIEAGKASSTVHIGDRAVLGVEVVESNRFVADGVAVGAVEEGSPAADAGIRSGDVITAVDGTNVASPDQLQAVLGGHSPGDRVQVAWTATSGTAHAATVRLVAGPPA